MRYLINVVHDKPEPPNPPQELFDAMGSFVAKLAADGILIDGAGLAPITAAKRVDLHGGKVKVLDGPFAESKEWVGGYFLVQVRSEAEALEVAKQSIDLHDKYFPGFDVIHEVRQILDEE